MSTIFKVLIHNSIKSRNSNNGFTLLELLIGLVLMSVVGGLAMNAFVQTSTSFRQDKKDIETSQDLSAVLEIIGNDIRQAGENINDGSFPAIEFTVATAGDDPTLVPGSSKIIVRRAVSLPMTLCQSITAAMATTTSLATAPTTAITPIGTLTVADNTLSGTAPNCTVGTQTSPLFATRPNATYVPNQATTLLPILISPAVPLPTGANGTLALVLPDALRQARDYRCAQVDPNPTLAYTSPLQPSNADFCPAAPTIPSVRIAVSDGRGHMLILNQTGEVDQTVGSFTKYGIRYNASFVTPDPAIANNVIAATTLPTFNPGDPVYVIEERVYTLVRDPNSDPSLTTNIPGILSLSRNGAPPTPIIKGITNFNIAARRFTDALQQTVNVTPAGDTINPNPVGTIPTTTNPICSDSPTAAIATASLTTGPLNPQYVCKFNYKTATDLELNWKQIAGVRISLQANYDGSGKSATPTAADAAKLVAAAEYFPRNVLSK
jgi:prepilin-type N-terminal cleavage/methylation domain-containing protein